MHDNSPLEVVPPPGWLESSVFFGGLVVGLAALLWFVTLRRVSWLRRLTASGLTVVGSVTWVWAAAQPVTFNEHGTEFTCVLEPVGQALANGNAGQCDPASQIQLGAGALALIAAVALGTLVVRRSGARDPGEEGTASTTRLS
jgi:hypothetical protein